MSHWDTEDWDIGVGTQWREITESLPEPRCNGHTMSKLAEIPVVVIVELHDAIVAECAQPTRSEMAKQVAAARASREFDDTDPNMLGLFEPNFSDRERRNQERTRKLAAKALDDLREGKGNKRFCPRSDGIGAATKCALIVSIKLNWLGVRTKQAQAACQALHAAAGGETKRLGGTPNRTDGFWRDRLREALQWRDTLYSRIIERALTL